MLEKNSKNIYIEAKEPEPIKEKNYEKYSLRFTLLDMLPLLLSVTGTLILMILPVISYAISDNLASVLLIILYLFVSLISIGIIIFGFVVALVKIKKMLNIISLVIGFSGIILNLVFFVFFVLHLANFKI